LKEKTTEFEKLKLEWDSKTNELIGTYMKKLADEKERALTVRKSLVSFFLLNNFPFLGTIEFTRQNGERSS
jgi:hypothetical protein